MHCECIHLKDHFSFLGNNGCDPIVDLYLPYNMTEMHKENQKRPCLLVCPGGGYEFCSQRESEPIALHFLPEGFNVFVLTYSVSPNRFPTQITEVAATMELIHQNADMWNCDINRVAIIGFSAGGHLAAHYSTSYDCDAVRARFPNSKPVNASILSYPVITSDERYAHMGSFENLVGHLPLTQDEHQFFSCDCRVSAKTPPTFLWHTATDDVVPVMNALLYAQALNRYNVPMEIHIYPQGRHGLATVDAQTCDELPASVARVNEWLYNVKKWLNSIFFPA